MGEAFDDPEAMSPGEMGEAPSEPAPEGTGPTGEGAPEPAEAGLAEDEVRADPTSEPGAGEEAAAEPAPGEVEPQVEIHEPKLEPAEAEPVTPEESRVGRFLRRALRWLTAVVVIFGIGFGVAQFAQVQPLTRELGELRSQLETARNAADQLQQDLDELEGVQEENQSLRSLVQETEAHLALLSVLVDVTSAQLAIAQEDPTAAKAALADTGARLDELDQSLGADQVSGLRERLRLVLEGVDADSFAAQRDLEILANNVLGMERDLFGDG